MLCYFCGRGHAREQIRKLKKTWTNHGYTCPPSSAQKRTISSLQGGPLSILQFELKIDPAFNDLHRDRSVVSNL